jgi:hypothetical protein
MNCRVVTSTRGFKGRESQLWRFSGGNRINHGDRDEAGIRRWNRFTVAASISATALVGLLVFTAVSSQALSSHQSARTAAAESACNSYLSGIQPTPSQGPSAGLATIADAYPTTASNLAAWLLTFDPMAESSAYSSIPPSEVVSACVVKGSWTLPNQSILSGADVHYEIVMVAPNGAATPRMWGGSQIANAKPPAVGS